MKIQHLISIEADKAGARYDNVVQGLRGVYLAAVQEPGLGTARQMAQIRDAALTIVNTYLETEDELIFDAFDEIVTNAQGSTESELAVSHADEQSEALSELLDATQSYVMQELSLQAHRDIITLIDSVRRAALDQRLSGAPRSASVSPDPVFNFRDRRNFRIKSRVFVRATWRASLLSLYNETVLLTLADYGHDRAGVEHLDPKSPFHGQIVAMSPEDDEYPTYGEIRTEIFHPNSDAIITPLRS